MDSIVQQVVAATVAAIAKMVTDTATWIEWEPTESLRHELRVLRGLGVHHGTGNRVTVVIPDTPEGRRVGHRLANAALDQGTADLDLPDTAHILDAYGRSVLAW